VPGAETFRASADAYDRHVGRYGAPLAAALIAFARVEPGMRALDVGCGPAALTAALAERLGEASVCAADPSEPFADACRTRLPLAEVVVATAEALPFADHALDATLSQLVVNFMRDPEAGVREMARVTRPGGVVASCVWDYAGEMTLLRAFWDAAREVDRERAAAADEGTIMRWCAEGELAELWRDTGLRAVHFGPLVVRAGYADFEDLWSPLPTGVGPPGAFCTSLDDERRAALHDAYRSRLGVGDGPFELTARACRGRNRPSLNPNHHASRARPAARARAIDHRRRKSGSSACSTASAASSAPRSLRWIPSAWRTIVSRPSTGMASR
jgi:SAM-dependent methyltransferase